VEDLCKPHPLAGGLILKPTPAPDLQVRAGRVILHLRGAGGETNLFGGPLYEDVAEAVEKTKTTQAVK
jgi:hypothetical protein